MLRDDAMEYLEVRRYGERGPAVVVLHGGPGAPGYMAPVCRELASGFTVIEPLQRCSGQGPVTVRRHLEDLRQVIEMYCREVRPALVGHSWGAMLLLAYAAAYPGTASRIVLIACGTFDTVSRASFQHAVRERTTPAVAERLREVSRRVKDADARLCVMSRILEPLYSCDLLPHQDETVQYDAVGQRETWSDMLKLQRNGIYPAAFTQIREPVLMLHGDTDPHPGEMIRDSLLPAMPQLEYLEMARCGHYPWLERHAKECFFAALTSRLAETAD